MRNAFRRMFCVAMMLVFVIGLVPQRVEASTVKEVDKIENAPRNTWITVKHSGGSWTTETTYFYKIVVPADGYIRIDAKNRTGDNNGELLFGLKRKKSGEMANSLGYLSYPNLNTGKSTDYRAVKKGTYYIHFNGGVKFKWSFTKVKNTTNYCRARATNLAAKKKQTVVFQRGYEFSRWYKIVLKKKKTITVKIKALDSDHYGNPSFAVYDDMGEEVWSPRKGISKVRLPKGTYYIRLYHDEMVTNLDKELTRIMELTWK